MNLDLNTARQYTDLIIANFEGGYYHPKMKAYLKNGDRLGNSGETMYGLDFAAGGSEIGNSQFAQEVHAYFAPYVEQIQDNATAFKIYSDKADGKKVAPADLGERWRNMAAAIMLDRFKSYFSKLDPGAQQIILTDPALFTQFWYGAWNGPTAFNKFAEVMNKAYGEGQRDPQTLNRVVQDARYARGAAFNQSSTRMDALTSQMYGKPNYPETPATTEKRRVLPWLLLGTAIIYLIYKSK